MVCRELPQPALTRAPARRVLVVLSVVGSALSASFWANGARADAIDVTWVLSHVSWKRSPFQALCTLVVILAVDYALNLVVVALPAARYGLPLSKTAADTIGFTIIAQIADRFGMMLCAATIVALRIVGHMGTTPSDFKSIMIWSFVANFVTSGMLIWFLSIYYLTRRWHVPRRNSVLIATLAAVVTNPAWVVAMAPFPRRHCHEPEHVSWSAAPR